MGLDGVLDGVGGRLTDGEQQVRGGAALEIRDHDRWDAAPSDPHRGRGMHIMAAVADGEVVIDRGAGGTVVTLRHRREERTA